MADKIIKSGRKPGRIKLVVGLLLALGLPTLLYYGFNKWISYREHVFEREAIQSLKDLAIAQEDYLFTETDGYSYAENIAVLEKLGYFIKNPNVIIVSAIGENGASWFAVAKHIKGGRVRCSDSLDRPVLIVTDNYDPSDEGDDCNKPILIELLMDDAGKKWTDWQDRMEAEYKKLVADDRDPNQSPQSREQDWKTFLTTFNADNPLTFKDSQLRCKAAETRYLWSTMNEEPGKKNKRFTVSAEGIIHDTKTGLEWFVNPCSFKSSDIRSYKISDCVENLDVGGCRWRLPEFDELKSIFEKGVGERNRNQVFGEERWNVWELNYKKRIWGFTFVDGTERNPKELDDLQILAVRYRWPLHFADKQKP